MGSRVHTVSASVVCERESRRAVSQSVSVSVTVTISQSSVMARQVPIKMGDHSVIDTEMCKMEDEMTRFRSELLHREEPREHSSITSSSFPSAMITQQNSSYSTTTTSSHQTSGTN